jgi:hypothetical protein
MIAFGDAKPGRLANRANFQRENVTAKGFQFRTRIDAASDQLSIKLDNWGAGANRQVELRAGTRIGAAKLGAQALAGITGTSW